MEDLKEHKVIDVAEFDDIKKNIEQHFDGKINPYSEEIVTKDTALTTTSTKFLSMLNKNLPANGTEKNQASNIINGNNEMFVHLGRQNQLYSLFPSKPTNIYDKLQKQQEKALNCFTQKTNKRPGLR